MHVLNIESIYEIILIYEQVFFESHITDECDDESSYHFEICEFKYSIFHNVHI